MKLTLLLTFCALFAVHAAPAAASPTDDPKAEQLFQREAQVLRSLKSIRADVTETFYTILQNGKVIPNASVSHVRLLRPNFERVDNVFDKTFCTDASNGKTEYFYTAWDYQITTYKPGATGQRLGLPFARTLSGFFLPGLGDAGELARQKSIGTFLSLRALGPVLWQGQTCQVVQWRYREAPVGGLPVLTDRLYFGVDGLLRRAVKHSTVGYTIDTQMPSPVLNPTMTAASFAYTPPAPPMSIRIGRFLARLLSHF